MKADQRYLVLDRQIFGINALSQSRSRWRATTHRKIFATNNNPPTSDFPKPQNKISRIVTDEIACFVVNRCARDGAKLFERTVIQKVIDALSQGQSVLTVLLRNRRFTTLTQRQCSAAFYLVNFRFPAHYLSLSDTFHDSLSQDLMSPTPGSQTVSLIVTSMNSTEVTVPL
jgi:hypothetical protein